MRVCFCVKQMFDTDQTFLMDPFPFSKLKLGKKDQKLFPFPTRQQNSVYTF